MHSELQRGRRPKTALPVRRPLLLLDHLLLPPPLLPPRLLRSAVLPSPPPAVSHPRSLDRPSRPSGRSRVWPRPQKIWLLLMSQIWKSVLKTV